jgi:hypothetical protein
LEDRVQRRLFIYYAAAVQENHSTQIHRVRQGRGTEKLIDWLMHGAYVPSDGSVFGCRWARANSASRSITTQTKDEQDGETCCFIFLFFLGSKEQMVGGDESY